MIGDGAAAAVIVEVVRVAGTVMMAVVLMYAHLHCASRVEEASRFSRGIWLTASAAALEAGVWSMYVGEPASRQHQPVDVDLHLIAVSVVAAFAAAIMSAYFMSKAASGSRKMVLAAVAMGLSLVVMLQVARSVMGFSTSSAYDLRLIALSLGLVLMAAVSIVWLTHRLQGSLAAEREGALKSAVSVIIGVGIAGAHYAEMILEAEKSGTLVLSPTWRVSVLALLLGIVAVAAAVMGAWSLIVSHRLRVQGELERLAAIVASSNDAIISANREGIIRTWNVGAERLFGYSAEEVCGRQVSLLTPSQSPEIQPELIARVGAGECIQNFEAIRRRKDGSLLNASISLSPIRGPDGRIIGISTVTRDITAQKRAELELRLSEERYRLVTSATQDIIWDWDLATDTVQVSDAIHTVLGHPKSFATMTPDRWYALVHPDDLAALKAAVASVVEGPESQWTSEFRVQRGDGSYAIVADRAYLVRDEQGVPVRMVGSVADITERREAERTMRHAQRNAEAANRAKSEFLANMSHEIRTPMNGIIGMLELVMEVPIDPERRGFLQSARSSAEGLLTVINDILDFSKIESGTVTLDEQPFLLGDMLAEFKQPLGLRAAQKGLRFSVYVDPAVPDAMVIDVSRLRQILTNLVGNAIKFTMHGDVSLRVEVDRRTRRPTEPQLHFIIRDTGIGISKEKQLSIFDAFVQADASTTREFGGTGLGLAIAARLARLMGGKVSVTSTLGQGSTFQLSLPLREAPTAPKKVLDALGSSSVRSQPAALRHRTIPSMRILLADDNEVNQKFMASLLRRRTHQVTVVGTGREVLAALGGASFDVILMDVQMPDLGGFDTTALIRGMEEGTGRHIPIIAVTARAMVGDRERCLDAGMDDYLSKPVHLGDLYEALARWAPGGLHMASRAAVRTVANIDRAALLDMVDGDETLLGELIAVFSRESQRLAGEIRRAVQERDAGATRAAAHALKGAAANLRAKDVVNSAAVLEQIADAGNLEHAESVLIKLEGDVLHSITALASMTNVVRDAAG
jgi:PAS domain S-box-containing protein